MTRIYFSMDTYEDFISSSKSIKLCFLYFEFSCYDRDRPGRNTKKYLFAHELSDARNCFKSVFAKFSTITRENKKIVTYIRAEKDNSD